MNIEIKRLVARKRKSLTEIAREYADKGYSRRMAADELGVKYHNFIRALAAECPGVIWHGARNSARVQEARTKAAKNRLATLAERGEVITVTVGQKTLRLSEAAKIAGISRAGMWRRYQRGIRGKDLIAPASNRRHQRKSNTQVHRLGYSERDVLMIQAYAKENGVRSAMSKFGISHSAASAAERGEMWRFA